MSLPLSVAKADMGFTWAMRHNSLRSFAGLACTVLFAAACSSTAPVIPPTELTSIKNVESRFDRLWSRKLEQSTEGRFEPLVLNDVVYAASRAGEVIAIERETGKTRWKKQLEVSLGSGVGGADNAVYVSSSNGLVLALSTADGEVLWETQASSEVLVPVSAGFGTVVVRSADGRLVSLDPETGEELWSVTYTPPALTLNGYSRPMLLDGGVLVGLDDGRLLALNSNQGRVLWESVVSVPSGRSEVERLSDIDGSIRVDDSAIYVANYQGKLARIEPSRGDIIWSVPISSTAGVAVSSTVAIVVDEDDELHAFDKENGQLLWQQDALKHRRLSAPQVITENLAVVGDLQGFLHIVSTSDGRLIGRTRVGRRSIAHELPLHDNTLLVQSADGTVAALRAQQTAVNHDAQADDIGETTKPATDMKPVIALVGRPNVGKSTLFNKLTRSQDALVADMPGLTRDRQYGDGRVGDWPYLVIDTGGLSGEPDTLDAKMADQTLEAVREADLVVFMVDGRSGVNPVDEDIADILRRQAGPVLLCVNKIDGVGEDKALLDFYALGFAETVAIAASHNRGVSSLIESAATVLGLDVSQLQKTESGSERERNKDIRIAFVGRPNVGKSTLINRLIGEQRVIAYDQPGTTRDAVAIPFERAGKQ